MPLSKAEIFDRIMYKCLPEYYRDFPVVNSMMEATAEEFARIDAAAQDIFNQLFIDTATWSIRRWEELHGIKTPADTTLTIEERRAAVKVAMQTKRVMSKQGIKDVFTTYNNMQVAITENNPAYSVDIKFTDLRGVPANLPEIQAQMLALLPAHIAVTYSYSWFLWSEFDDKGLLWSALDAANMRWDALEVWT